MANEIKQDLGQLKQQVEALTKGLEGVGAAALKSRDAVKELAGVKLSKTGARTESTKAAGPGDYLTETGMEGSLRGRGAGKQRTATQASAEQALDDLDLKNNLAGAPEAGKRLSFFSKTLSEASRMSPNVRNETMRGLENQAKRVDQAPQNDLSMLFVRQMRGLIDDIKSAGKEFDKAVKDLKEAEQAKSLNNIADKQSILTEKTANLRALTDEAGKMQTAGGAFLPPGTPPSSGSFVGRMGRDIGRFLGNPLVQGAAVAGISAIRSAEMIGIDLNKGFAGAALYEAENIGGLAQLSQQRHVNSIDMSNVDNLIKYRGDVLFPGKTRYLGASGKSLSTAMDSAYARLAGLAGERSLGITNSITGTIASMGKSGIQGALGGAAIGSLFGGIGAIPGAVAGAAFAGGTSLIDGATRGFLDYQNNPISRMKGGLQSSVMGSLFLGDKAKEQADIIASGAMGNQMNITMKEQDALQEAESKSRFINRLTIQAQMDAKNSQFRGVGLVGKYASSSQSAIESILGTTDRQGLNVASRQGMSFASFMDSQNQLTNVMGPGQKATLGQTSDLLSASKSGLGSMDDFMQAIAAMNKNSTGGNNIEKLTSVLSSAVSIGFDKANLSKQFVQGISELSRSMRAGNIVGLGQKVATTAQFLSPTGRATEHSFETTVNGMKGLEDFTKSNSGVQGVLKLQSLIRSGVGVAGGAAVANGMGVGEIEDTISSLKQDPSGASIRSERGRLFFARNGRNAARTIQTMGRLESAETMTLNSSVKGAFGASAGGLAKSQAHKMNKQVSRSPLVTANPDDDIAKIKGRNYEDFTSKIVSAAMTQQGMTMEAAQAYAAGEARKAGLVGPGDLQNSSFRKKLADLAGGREDVVAQNLQKFISSELKTGNLNAKVSRGEYSKILSENTGILGFQTSSGQRVSPELINSLNDTIKKGGSGASEAQSTLSEIDSTLAGMSRLDIVRQAESSEAVATGQTVVTVSNFSELVAQLRGVLHPAANPPTAKKEDPNSSTGVSATPPVSVGPK